MRSLLIFLFFSFFALQLNGQKKIPVMAFHGFTPNTVNDYNLKKFKEAGFDIHLTVFDNDEQLINALDLSQKYNIKVLAFSRDFENNPEKTVQKIKDHPALYGYFLLDEPSPNDFDKVQNLITRIKKIDDKHPVYVNLYPSYSPSQYLGNLDYRDYVSQFFQKVTVDFISFDYYPVVYNQVRANWYENLEIVRDYSLKLKKDFWAFACTTIHHYYREPTLPGIRLQQYGNLLYGAKGLQYFTYITMDDDYWKRNNYGYSIIYNNGQETPTYAIVKKVNNEIQKLSWIFAESKVDSVYHMGDSIPVGTKRLNYVPKPFKMLRSNNNRVLVSFLSNKYRKFIILQNKDLKKTITVTYQPANSSLKRVNKNNNKIYAIENKMVNAQIEPGDILIFTY